jgi:hypothetical protein
MRAMVFIRVIRFLALGELRMIEPKLMLGQLFDFPHGIDAGGLFNLPTLSKRNASCAILVFLRAICCSH